MAGTRRRTAILVAAGSGERFGAGIPKAFVELGGRPLLWWSLRAFVRAGVDDLVVVTVAERLDEVEALAEEARAPLSAACTGGVTRQESVDRGLASCPPRDDLIGVHDAARPLVSPALVRATFDALVDPWSAVAPGLPVVDTLKLVDAGRQRVLRTVDRTGLWGVQTPQVFPRAVLERVHTRSDGEAGAVTDDLALVEAAGGRVRLIPGERRNLKVTYAEDLRLAEALLVADERAS